MNCRSAYYKYVVYTKKPNIKNRLIKLLLDKYNISCPPNVYDHPCHLQNVTTDNNTINKDDEFPNMDYIIANHFCLPMYNSLKEEEVLYICDSLNKIGKEL